MSKPSKRSTEIVRAFNRSIKTRSRSEIEQYSLDELKSAKAEYSRDAGYAHFSAIEDRVRELEEDARSRRNQKERWKDRAVGAGVTILVSLLARFVAC